MNYRHSYHAGNFADVVKHAVLARLVEYLKLKEKAFRVIDTHAGRGLYELTSGDAEKTGEWRDGIGRLVEGALPAEAAKLLAPYLATVRSVNPDNGLSRYPGSPLLVRQLLRKQDRLTAIELHPDDTKALAARFEGDFQVRTIALDGWLALGAHLPPKEKRGLVLIDPPFESPSEFDQIGDFLQTAQSRFVQGQYLVWYPVKKRYETDRFLRRIAKASPKPVLDIRFDNGAPAQGQMHVCGMVVLNPPWKLDDQLRPALDAVARALAQGPQSEIQMRWIKTEAECLSSK